MKSLSFYAKLSIFTVRLIGPSLCLFTRMAIDVGLKKYRNGAFMFD
jgi:hypothetical protein